MYALLAAYLLGLVLAILVAVRLVRHLTTEPEDTTWYSIDAKQRLERLDARAKDITVGGNPVEITGTENFSISTHFDGVMVKPWKEHTETHPTPTRIVPIPACGSVLTRVCEEPYFDREFIPANIGSSWSVTCFFQNTRSFTHDVPGWPRSKQWSIDTNLIGNGGCIPAGHHFKVEGITLVPSRTTDQEVVDIIRDHATLELLLGSTPFMKWPADLLIPGTPRKQKQNKWASRFQKAEDRAQEKSKGVLRLDKSVELLQYESFMFQLKLDKDLPKPADLKLILHGKMTRPLCA